MSDPARQWMLPVSEDWLLDATLKKVKGVHVIEYFGYQEALDKIADLEKQLAKALKDLGKIK